MTTDSNETIDNRQRIMVVAEELFAMQGFAATSVREIVHKAEVTAPVLYYYFGSKDDLLKTLVAERFAQFMARVKPGALSAQSVEDVIGTWCWTLIDETVSRPTTLRLILGALWGPPIPHLRDCVFSYQYEITKLFIEAIQRVNPSIPAERARFALVMFHGMMNSFLFPLLEGLAKEVSADIVASITPRLVAIMYDDYPLPEATMASLDQILLHAVSATSETKDTETP